MLPWEVELLIVFPLPLPVRLKGMEGVGECAPQREEGGEGGRWS